MKKPVKTELTGIATYGGSPESHAYTETGDYLFRASFRTEEKRQETCANKLPLASGEPANRPTDGNYYAEGRDGAFARLMIQTIHIWLQTDSIQLTRAKD